MISGRFPAGLCFPGVFVEETWLFFPRWRVNGLRLSFPPEPPANFFCLPVVLLYMGQRIVPGESSRVVLF